MSTKNTKNEYRRRFDPNEEPLAFSRLDAKSIPEVKNKMAGSHGKAMLFAKVTETLRTEDDLPRFEGCFGRAAEVAMRRKEQQEAARRKGMQAFTDKFDQGIFKKPDNPPGPEKPPSQPPPQQ